jgi:RimJ/RimL family protein N-acetyltransferase
MAQSTNTPILTFTRSKIREYMPGDAVAVVQQCNNHNISQWMTNVFPHPYTLQDAHNWINHNISIAAKGPPQNFVLVDPMTDSAIGGIGIKPGADVFAHTAEIGYWLGEEYWGRGIMSEALPAFTRWVWDNRETERLWAGVYDGNTPSRRLLEKAGYRCEGLMRGHVRKEGVVRDLHVYGMTRADESVRERSASGNLQSRAESVDNTMVA